MKLKPIITSLLDTDLYKFNMNQVMFHKHTDLTGDYYFKCRNKGVKFTEEQFQEIKDQVDHLCTLTFKQDELDYLNSIRFLKRDFVEFLKLWRPLREYVYLSLDNGELGIHVHGPLFSAMQFEIYLLEIVNEVYFRMHPKYSYEDLEASAQKLLDENIAKFKDRTYDFKFAEFGCRRRLSKDWEDHVIKTYVDSKVSNLVGTSNVYLARKYGLTPIGTYAHEYVQMYQGIDSIPLAYTNHFALQDWYDEYKGDNGTALTDTITTPLFLLDFDRANCNNYSGVRHDSGDPYSWGERMIKHYESYGIDPKAKTLLFSDSLNFDKAQKLYNTFRDRAKVSFGIGTYVSNNTVADPLNIVIKLQYVNGKPVAKLSDNPEKAMCRDAHYLEYLKRSVQFRIDRSQEADDARL